MFLFKISVLNQISLWSQDEFSLGFLKGAMKTEHMKIENITYLMAGIYNLFCMNLSIWLYSNHLKF